MRSLRTRLILGALLWTLGITWVVHVGSPWTMRHFSGHVVKVHFSLLTMLALALVVAGLSQVASGLRWPSGSMAALQSCLEKGEEESAEIARLVAESLRGYRLAAADGTVQG